MCRARWTRNCSAAAAAAAYTTPDLHTQKVKRNAKTARQAAPAHTHCLPV